MGSVTSATAEAVQNMIPLLCSAGLCVSDACPHSSRAVLDGHHGGATEPWGAFVLQKTLMRFKGQGNNSPYAYYTDANLADS